MTPLQELSELLSGGARVVVISQRYVDLKGLEGENLFFVLRMVEGSLAAGGRGGGFGERRVTRVALFSYHDGSCEKLFETEDESRLGDFEIPYHVSRMPFTMNDGSEGMGYGVVDPELVAEYSKRID